MTDKTWKMLSSYLLWRGGELLRITNKFSVSSFLFFPFNWENCWTNVTELTNMYSLVCVWNSFGLFMVFQQICFKSLCFLVTIGTLASTTKIIDEAFLHHSEALGTLAGGEHERSLKLLVALVVGQAELVEAERGLKLSFFSNNSE